MMVFYLSCIVFPFSKMLSLLNHISDVALLFISLTFLRHCIVELSDSHGN